MKKRLMGNKGLFLLLLLSLVTSGCKDQKEQPLDPQLEAMRNEVVELFDSFDAVNQDAFLQTFRSSAESGAESALSGSELSERLEFIAELEAELRKRKK